MKKLLTIAGSDCSGGAGIQADLKTFAAHKVYGMSVITAITVQNTQGVSAIQDIDPDIVAGQIEAIFTDIRPDAVKIGMVSNIEIIEIIAEKLEEYRAKNIVVDPVMVATSGSSLMDNKASQILVDKLLPLADIITPNIPEAEVLSGIEIKNKKDMEVAAKKIREDIDTVILIKGGHSEEDADDLLYDGEKFIWIKGERIDNDNTHGTGCTLSSAIASNLAKGFKIEQSVRNSKDYITGAIRDGLDLGKSRGPLNHLYVLK